ncbi:MAG: hypothetical protein PHS41_13370 [Victivallaceae bacterium]|nr:hypothetical protein [Victivallaceae bacterium]
MDTKYDPVLGTLRESDGADSAAEAVDYTINGEQPDENCNFEVTAESIGAAEAQHQHDIAEVENLQAELDGKSGINHTHELVSGVAVGGETVSGELTLAASGNLLLSVSGQVVTLTPEPFAENSTASVVDANTANTEPLKVFSGTRAEWDAFVKESGVRYIVFLHE